MTFFLNLIASILFFTQAVNAAFLELDQIENPDTSVFVLPLEPLFFEGDVSRLEKSDITRLIWLARQHLIRGGFEQSRIISEQVLAVKAYNIEALSLSAAAYKGLGDDSAFEALSEKIKQLEPKSPLLPLALATVYQVNNNHDAAQKVYLDALRTAIDQVDLRMGLANLYLEQQDFKKARIQYLHVLEQEGLSMKYTLNANFALCRLDLHEKAYDKVINRASKLIELYPPFPQSYQLLASAFLAEGDTKQAVKTYNSLIKANPESSLPYQELAVIALDLLKNDRQALNYATEGFKRFPNDARIRDVLGWTYYQTQKPQDASIHFEAATRLAADNPQFHYHSGLAHQKLGNKKRASAAYQRALGLIDQAKSILFKDELKKLIKSVED